MSVDLRDQVFCDDAGLWIRDQLGNCRPFDIHDYESLASEREAAGEALQQIAGFKRTRPGGAPGSYQRGYDIGFNNAGLVAAGIAQAALKAIAIPDQVATEVSRVGAL